MRSRTIKIAAVAAVLTVAAYWYWSPLLAIRQLQSAAKNGDAAAFNERVDYPKVRESIKGNFSAMFEDNLAANSDDAVAKAGAAFGAKLGGVMVDRFVDAVVRPEMMMRAMQSGHLSPMKDKQPAGTVQPEASPSGQPDYEPTKSKLKWVHEREGLNKVAVYATEPEEADKSGRKKFSLGLVLHRSGFATWKLSEVRLPGLNNK